MENNRIYEENNLAGITLIFNDGSKIQFKTIEDENNFFESKTKIMKELLSVHR